MARPGDAGNDRSNGGNGGRLVDTVKDRIIVALLAVIFGGGGAAGFMNVNPPRPDPFTGQMGKELEARFMKHIEEINKRDEVLRNRVEAHLVRGEAGFWRIEQLEHAVKELKSHAAR